MTPDAMDAARAASEPHRFADSPHAIYCRVCRSTRDYHNYSPPLTARGAVAVASKSFIDAKARLMLTLASKALTDAGRRLYHAAANDGSTEDVKRWGDTAQRGADDIEDFLADGKTPIDAVAAGGEAVTIEWCAEHRDVEKVPGPYCPMCAYLQARKDGVDSTILSARHALHRDAAEAVERGAIRRLCPTCLVSVEFVENEKCPNGHSMPDPATCEHADWDFKRHGRVCFNCSRVVADFGD